MEHHSFLLPLMLCSLYRFSVLIELVNVMVCTIVGASTHVPQETIYSFDYAFSYKFSMSYVNSLTGHPP